MRLPACQRPTFAMIFASQMGASPVGVIFISHSSRNGDEAVAVRDWLRGEGYAETFLDLDPEHGLAPGQRWEEELQKAGERCAAVVVLISPDWCESKWCFHEFKFAKALGKKVFPVLIRPTPWGDIPQELTSQFQLADISVAESRDDGLNRLRIGLQRAGLDPKHFTLPEGRSPYRGLQSLEEADAAVFFGRDAQITAGLDVLRQMRGGKPKRILTIAAASGAGKSSFLKAGLLARLRRDEENFLILPIWRPGRDALSGATGLVNALGAADAQSAKAALEVKQAHTVNRLKAFAEGAGEPADRPPPTIVLPLDQAEELFSVDNTTAAAAITLLAETLAAKSDLILAATIRTDSLSGLQNDPRIGSLIELFSLPALQPSAFKEVIEGPARLASPPLKIEPALTDRLIADLNQADALPLLAFTLARLAAEFGDDHTLELRDYESGLGGVGGAINSAVEAALKNAEADPALPRTRHELDTLARSAFIPWLVQLDKADASPMRRVAKLSDLPETTRPLIRHFVEERLLVSSVAEDEAVIEVSHEAVLRHWRGLAAWISEEQVMLEGLHRIIRSANEWGANEKTLIANSPELLVHRGERLRAAEAFLQRSDMAAALRGIPLTYLQACRAIEDLQVREAKDQAEREIRQRRRASRWQKAAAIFLLLGFGALLTGAGLVINEQRNFSKLRSASLAKVATQFLNDGNALRALQVSIIAGRESWLAPRSPDAEIAFLESQKQLGKVSIIQFRTPSFSSLGGVAFSEDESKVLLWGYEGTSLIDVASGEQIGGDIGSKWAQFSDDGTKFLTLGESRLNVWDSATGDKIGKSLHVEGGVNDGAAFSHDGLRILAWSRGKLPDNFSDDPMNTQLLPGYLRLWDVSSGVLLWEETQKNDTDRLLGARFSTDDARIVTWGELGAQQWDSNTGAKIEPVFAHDRGVDGIAFSNDGTRILTWGGWGGDNAARLWDIDTGAQIGPGFQHEGTVDGAKFSNDDARVLTWSSSGGDNTARLWDIATGVQIGPALQHAGAVSGATFSNDGTRILTWSEDNTARLWDAEIAKPIRPPLQHKGAVHGAVFSKHEHWVLTWSEDGTARAWTARAPGGPLKTYGHDGAISGAAYSLNGGKVFTWSQHDKTLRIWQSNPVILEEMNESNLRRVCEEQLRGNLVPIRTAFEKVQYPHVLHLGDDVSDWLLEDYLGEDVCAMSKSP